MPFGRLFCVPGTPRTTVLQAVAKANGLDIELVDSFTGRLHPDHTKASPLGKAPAFIGEDGFVLHEVLAIAIYFASQNEKTTLLGKTKQDYATIVKWMSYFNSEVLGALAQWYLPLVGRQPYNKKSVDEGIALSAKAVAPIEEHLLNNTYLAGERISLADLFGASIISRGFQYFYDKEWRAQNPNVSRWYETVINQPVYAEVAEKFEFLEKPALTNVAPKTDAPAKEKKEKAPKAPKAPKAEKKPEPEQEEEDEPAAPTEKYKHPLEALPKASLPLDEWKRMYSNHDGPTAMAWFWDNVNFEEYSIWKAKYKYNSELAMTFMSNNLIGGFNNRLEASRKYLFGASSVFGVNNDSIIEGAFVIRGQDYLPVFDVAPDYESYEFEKLDPTSDETKAYLKDMWTEDAPVITVDGKEYKYASGKVFK